MRCSALWMAVTPDLYELTLAVADSSDELASMMGVKRGSILKNRWRESHGVKVHDYFVRIVKYEPDPFWQWAMKGGGVEG